MAKYFTLTLLLAVLIFAACNKKATPSAASMSDMLRKGKWRVSSGTLTVKLPDGRDTILQYPNWIFQCHRDDYFVFNGPTTGAAFNGSTLCTLGDPDSISFVWALTNNNTSISFHNSDHLFYSVAEVILPYVFDTLQHSPLVLDTLHGVNDTDAGYTRSVIVLDTIWQVNFDTIPVPNTDIYNAPISNFSQNAFTIYFTWLSSYPDSTNMHAGLPDAYPVIRADTFKYSVTFSNF